MLKKNLRITLKSITMLIMLYGVLIEQDPVKSIFIGLFSLAFLNVLDKT